jgi:nucleoside-diphosphate-sugar epimerase
MKIDLFGGTGFIGSEFAHLFQQETYIHPREDATPVSDNILYMISTTDNYNIFDDLYLDINTNLIKLLNVLENCKNKNVIFNFVSSWFVYGDTELPAHEESICNPKGFYSITKKCAEDLLISFCKTFDIKYRILRLSNVYGKSDNSFSKKKNALQYLIQEIKNNNPINLYFNGEFVRDYTHVQDICQAIKLVISCGKVNEIYNIGNGDPILFKDIIYFVKEKTNSKSKLNSIDQPDFHKTVQVKDMYLDTAKLKNLGYIPKYNIFNGIETLL